MSSRKHCIPNANAKQPPSKRRKYQYIYQPSVIPQSKPVSNTQLPPVIATKSQKKARPPPDPASTYLNLCPDLRIQLDQKPVQFARTLSKYKAMSKPNEMDKVELQEIKDQVSSSYKYFHGKKWTQDEFDDLYDALLYCYENRENDNLKEFQFYLNVKRVMMSTRTESAIRIKFDWLCSSANEEGFRHSEFAALSNWMKGTSEPTANDSSL